jgi:hypothetical protein
MICPFIIGSNDGFGSGDSVFVCDDTLSGWVQNNLDCDDQNALINPSASEVLDNDVDENCDGNIELYVLNQRQFSWVIYPNPNNGEFVVKTENPIYFEVIDQQGNVVARDMASKEKRIQLNALSNGVYLFKSSQGVSTFMIQK